MHRLDSVPATRKLGVVRTAQSPATKPGYNAGRAPAFKGMRLPAEILTREEVRALLGACSARSSTGLRDRALIIVMWRAGLRCGEALALYPKEIDFGRETITVLHGKGDKRRTVGIDPMSLGVIGQWMDRRRELGLTGHYRLFCTLNGNTLNGSHVRRLLPRLARRAGIEKRVHAHALRHTCAYELLEEGKDVKTIQTVLGHTNLAVTDRYLSHLNPATAIDTMRTRTWDDEAAA
jgi:integrase/recombinase XerD